MPASVNTYRPALLTVVSATVSVLSVRGASRVTGRSPERFTVLKLAAPPASATTPPVQLAVSPQSPPSMSVQVPSAARATPVPTVIVPTAAATARARTVRDLVR